MMQMQQQQGYFLEICRANLRTASDIMKASLESAQKMQGQQMEVLRSMLEENSRSARELTEVRSMDELVALQTRMAGAQMERAADLWGRMFRAASDTQVAMIGQVQSQVGELSERMREGYQVAARGAANASNGDGRGSVIVRPEAAAQEAARKDRKSA